jgi:hypothetical protein
MKRIIIIVLVLLGTAVATLVVYAFASTWGKTDLDIKIHINEKLVRDSGYGESPTFAIWLENTDTKVIRAVYVTRRAAEGDWEGKAEVPVALPKWFEIRNSQSRAALGSENVDAYSGATPKPGYFTARASLEPGSNWICWIEVNLAGDYNDFYKASNNEDSETDKFFSGQPAILYRAEIKATEGQKAVPTVVGMTVVDTDDRKIVQPLQGITSAVQIFDEITISVVRPKPRVIRK